MAKTRGLEPRQLSLDELLAQIEQQPGKLLKLPIEPDDIGGELLAILSKGLYTNPLDCIREYIQNAVDARAQDVTIKITGNSVMIFDDGSGMNVAELVQARQFGLSPKSLAEHVGFRGIGIYSGFDLCRRLRITSKRAGDSCAHTLVFDFAAMRSQLDVDKRADARMRKTSLMELLSEYTRIGRVESEYPVDRHFTMVDMEDISDVHIRELSNRVALRQYLLQNLPIDFADDFDHKKTINDQLYLHVPGYHAIRVALQSDGLEDEVVLKKAIPNLQPPSFGYITTSSQQQVAFYWACLNKERGRVQPRDRDKEAASDQRPSYEGLVYKVKGFTIGNRDKLRGMFERKPQLYPWYTGEIYVLDPNVIPNAARDDFETNQPKRALEVAVHDKLSVLEKDAETFQAQGVANERVEKYCAEIIQYENQVKANSVKDEYDTYARLDVILTELRRQRSKASQDNQRLADDLLRRADRLQKQVRKQVDSPSTEAARRKRAVRSKGGADRAPMPIIEPPPPTPTKTLPGILRDAGWELDGEIARLVEIIQSSFEDVLTIGTPPYRSLLSGIEAKLVAVSAEEA